MIRRFGRTTALFLAAGGLTAVASAQTDVISPANMATVNGTGGLNTVVRDAGNPRAYQIVFAASELTGVVGQQLTAITWRSFSTQATFPTAALVYADYEIRAATSLTSPATMSTTFASNLGPDVVLVQDGPLTIPVSNFPGVGTGTAPFAFGGFIQFQTPFTYAGGDLVIDVRHPGATSGTTGFLDGLVTTSTAQGYGTTVKAMSQTTATTPTVGTFTTAFITKLHFEPGTAVTGACCYANGSCNVTTATGCAAGGGTYSGDNVTCAAANCPQPPTGACCFESGICTVLTAANCAAQGGTYAGNNITCLAAACVQPGACCLPDGSCVILTSAKCTAATTGGTFSGNGTNCASAGCWTAPTLWKNGPLSTGATSQSGVPAPAGTTWAEVANNTGQLTVSNTNSGFSALGAIRDADDFTIVAAGGWQIDKVILPSYQTGSTTTPTITGATVQIWNGRPGDAGSAVVWGDTTTNRMTAVNFANMYRCFNTAVPAACGGALTAPDQTRPIMSVECSIGTTLPPGHYWLDWNVAGTLASGPWAPAVTIKGLRAATVVGNGRQFNAAWVDAGDPGQGCSPTAVIQDFSFEIRGSVLGGCYPNCDGSTSNPLLTANDFQCFLNEYAAGNSYANCDGSTANPTLTANDFQCFLNSYAAGCS